MGRCPWPEEGISDESAEVVEGRAAGVRAASRHARRLAERLAEVAKSLDDARHRNWIARADASWRLEESARLRRSAFATRRDSRAHLRFFALEGLVDGREVSAAMRPGELLADEALLERADLVTRCGDTFEMPEGSADPSLPATLSGPPLAVMLTLLRACDRPTRLTVGPAPIPRS